MSEKSGAKWGIKSYYKKLNTRSHFSDFWHRAKSWRTNKKIGARNERRKLNREVKIQI